MNDYNIEQVLAGVRVLVVEDSEQLLALMREMLEAVGATVAAASTANEALRVAAGGPFDVALTDLGLPDMPGETLIARLRSASHGRAPIVVVSGAAEARLARALEVGADGVFVKPIDSGKLIAHIARLTRAATRSVASVPPRILTIVDTRPADATPRVGAEPGSAG